MNEQSDSNRFLESSRISWFHAILLKDFFPSTLWRSERKHWNGATVNNYGSYASFWFLFVVVVANIWWPMGAIKEIWYNRKTRNQWMTSEDFFHVNTFGKEKNRGRQGRTVCNNTHEKQSCPEASKREYLSRERIANRCWWKMFGLSSNFLLKAFSLKWARACPRVLKSWIQLDNWNNVCGLKHESVEVTEYVSTNCNNKRCNNSCQGSHAEGAS